MKFETGGSGQRKTEEKPSAGVPERVDNPERAQMSTRILELAQRIQDGEASAFDILDMLPDNVSLQNGANPWTIAYRSLFELARTHPDLTQSLGEMADMIGQNPQMISPGDLVGIASDIAWDPRIHGFLKNGIIHSIGYALRFNDGLDYESAIAKRLDFTNQEHFTDTAHFLEFMRSLYNVADAYSYADDDAVVLTRVREALTRAVDAHHGSYLLNTRAQELLAAMNGQWQMWAEGDRVPFIITGRRYAWHREDGLYVADPGQYEDITARIEHFRALEARIKPPQELVDAAKARGEEYVAWTPDQQLMREREEAYKGIDEVFTHRLTYAELNETRQRIAPDAGFDEEYDFAYLTRKSVRSIIERDFEVKLENLSIPEQFQLLQFLKTVEKKDASPLLLQATQRLRKIGALRLEDIRGGALEVARGGSVSSGDCAAMLRVQHERYAAKYPVETFGELHAGPSAAFENSAANFYLYRKDGTIVTFVRFDAGADGKHMASFLTNPDFEGGGLGQTMLEIALEQEGAGGTAVYGECDPSLVPFYQRFGFRVARGPYTDKGGVATCDIVRDSAAQEVQRKGA